MPYYSPATAFMTIITLFIHFFHQVLRCPFIQSVSKTCWNNEALSSWESVCSVIFTCVFHMVWHMWLVCDAPCVSHLSVRALCLWSLLLFEIHYSYKAYNRSSTWCMPMFKYFYIMLSTRKAIQILHTDNEL